MQVANWDLGDAQAGLVGAHQQLDVEGKAGAGLLAHQALRRLGREELEAVLGVAQVQSREQPHGDVEGAAVTLRSRGPRSTTAPGTAREPIAMSAPSRSAAVSFGSSSSGVERSTSASSTYSPLARSTPAAKAAPLPRFCL